MIGQKAAARLGLRTRGPSLQNVSANVMPEVPHLRKLVPLGKDGVEGKGPRESRITFLFRLQPCIRLSSFTGVPHLLPPHVAGAQGSVLAQRDRLSRRAADEEEGEASDNDDAGVDVPTEELTQTVGDLTEFGWTRGGRDGSRVATISQQAS